MFDNNRYLTCGVDSTIPLELQLFLWDCVDRMPAPKDYLQVFELSPSGSMQSITHSSEEPEYRQVYIIPSDAPITEKLYTNNVLLRQSVVFVSVFLQYIENIDDHQLLGLYRVHSNTSLCLFYL